MDNVPIEINQIDVAIIGGGPAAITAAIWCADLGLSCRMYCREQTLGGQLNWIHAPITNYPTIMAQNGIEMAERFVSCLPENLMVYTDRSVISIEIEPFKLRLSDNTTVSPKAIVFATGVSRRNLGIAGEEEFAGRGILFSGAGSIDEVRGKRVVIIGGGDAALENAVMLSVVAERVTVIHRRADFSARSKFVDAAAGRENIDLLMSTEPTSIAGDVSVTSLRCRSVVTGLEREVDADAVLIRIGVEPNSELVDGIVVLDARGYVATDRNGATSVSGIFAIGDISNPIAPTIAGAVGDAATAIKCIRRMI